MVIAWQNLFGLPTSVLPGVYTIATLPNPSDNQAKYAFVTDLGGGADMVISDGTNWKHIRQGVITDVPIANNIAVTPLSSPPQIKLTGSGFASASSVNISTNNLYAGYTMRIVAPANVLGVLGTIGVSVVGGPAIPLLGGSWADMAWNGSSLVTTAKGSL